ncbi:hypothetical protein OESDEN_12310 [Oesophagostomum dentatum]|uniref:7TM GPCR serpentine receptor class x (Srx) domain-containing protein n=1 Tax=Oesophagostomum dentatum TaxID=61180 RepID=A0A0B1SRF6_OESDE|nr:hypothetical protein OESDEN_12310 [Oesophagostomum dentatum]
MLKDAGESGTQTFERALMTASMILVCVLGLLFNAMAMITVRLNPVLRSSFGILCFSHCAANFGILLVFLFWTTPLTFIQNSNNPSLTAKLCGMVLALLCYFPVDACYFVYDPTTWTWIFAENECGELLSKYNDLYPICIICSMKILLDASTLVKLRLNHVVRSHGMNLLKKAFTSNANIYSAKRKVEIRFFIQASIQGLALIYVIMSFNLINRLVETKMGMFLTVTLTWAASHAIDGLILLFFHFRRSYLSRREINTVNTSSHAKTGSTISLHK